MQIELFSTTDCPRCAKLSEFLDNLGVSYTKRVIDNDPDAETDALMLNIFSAPALRKDKEVLRLKELFSQEELNQDIIKIFVRDFTPVIPKKLEKNGEEEKIEKRVNKRVDKRWATLDGLRSE